MPKLSVIIIAKNESENIAECIKSASFANEVIVLDSGSSDNTVPLAEKLGAKVFNKPVVTTNFLSASNLIKNNEDGLIVDISVDGIFEGVKQLIENEELIFTIFLASKSDDIDIDTQKNWQKLWNDLNVKNEIRLAENRVISYFKNS